MVPNERRHTTRRAKQIRLRFTALADEHRAVTTSVSRAGAFAKASYVPGVGTTVTFEEVYGRGTARIWLRAKVVRTVEVPTLERPDTGFGMRFLEAYTQDDPVALEELIRYLDPAPAAPPAVEFEERKDGVFSVYRFDAATHDDSVGEPAERIEKGDEDHFEVDLSAELDRLEREAHRSSSEPAPQAPVSAPDDSGPEPPGPRRPRSRRRSVTGIFTALFSRGKDDPDPDDSHGDG